MYHRHSSTADGASRPSLLDMERGVGGAPQSPEPRGGAAPPPSQDNGEGPSPQFDSSALRYPHMLPKEQNHPSEVAVSHTAPRGRHTENRDGWASPEGDWKGHAWRFEFSFPQTRRPYGVYRSLENQPVAPVVCPPKKKISPEEKTALREKRIANIQRASRYHAEVALRKYNRRNNTKFELVEIRARNLFFEFGGGCYHYNFTAIPEDHHSADGTMKLFFSEVNFCLEDENDVLVCCIVEEKDAGHCYGCESYQPMMVHPSSRVYGGGNTDCIDYPESDDSCYSDQ